MPSALGRGANRLCLRLPRSLAPTAIPPTRPAAVAPAASAGPRARLAASATVPLASLTTEPTASAGGLAFAAAFLAGFAAFFAVLDPFVLFAAGERRFAALEPVPVVRLRGLLEADLLVAITRPSTRSGCASKALLPALVVANP